MRITDLIQKRGGKQISVEVEPPMLGRSISSVFKVLDPVIKAGVRYVNITYHAEQIVDYIELNNGRFPISQRRKPGTVGVAGAIQSRYASKGVEAVPHVICTSFTKYDIEEYLIDLGFLGIQNVMALRGDPPSDASGKKTSFMRAPGGCAHANELIRQIVNLKKGLYVGAAEGDPIDFCVGAACYPEGHPESKSSDEDLRWVKAKVDAGADYLVTQMFFDNDIYRRFVEKARNVGIEVPIVPGIKPLTSSRHLDILPNFFHCTIPEELEKAVLRESNNEANVRKVGIKWCVQQCRELLKDNAPSIHLYAARRSPLIEVVEGILKAR
ncbi:MAG: methylenetetrahydrofolate reductase [archaeon]